MSALERRLQILVDDERFARLEAESRNTGRSVGAIVRGAIDVHFEATAGVSVRSSAAHRLLERTAVPDGVEPDWAESKVAILGSRVLASLSEA